MSSSSNAVLSSESGSATSPRRSQRLLQTGHPQPAKDSEALPNGDTAPSSIKTTNLIPKIRAASRLLVRELGFMSTTLAGTSLSHSSVHALLEISTSVPSSTPQVTATSLAHALNLEKSSISRLVKKLVEAGLVEEQKGEDDKREKLLLLSEKGAEVMRGIHAFADRQVGEALGNLPDVEVDPYTVLDGISKYAHALQTSRLGTSPSAVGTNKVPNTAAKTEPQIEIKRGYQPGILGRGLQLHMEYYSSTVGFGAAFEAQVATDLGVFLSHLHEGGETEVWAAVLDGKIIGTVWMDGRASHQDGAEGEAKVRKALLRAFIVDSSVRGRGVGRRLLKEAVGWADGRGFGEVELWTFKGLDAARRLYESMGFVGREEVPVERWGKSLVGQHFVRKCMT